MLSEKDKKDTRNKYHILIVSESFYHPPAMYGSGILAWPPPHHHHHHLLVFMVSRVTGHAVVLFRMIYNNIICKKHSHYPQLLGTSYKVQKLYI